MSELKKFLLARISEDEALTGHLPGEVPPGRWRRGVTLPDAMAVVQTSTGYVVGTARPEIARHITHHDPARVLDECNSKRAIIAEFEAAIIYVREDLYRMLAHPYRDHPDFRPEWRL